jgi:hypothetical protein
VSLTEGGSLDRLRDRFADNSGGRNQEVIDVGLLLLSLILLEVVVQLFGGGAQVFS